MNAHPDIPCTREVCAKLWGRCPRRELGGVHVCALLDHDPRIPHCCIYCGTHEPKRDHQ